VVARAPSTALLLRGVWIGRLHDGTPETAVSIDSPDTVRRRPPFDAGSRELSCNSIKYLLMEITAAGRQLTQQFAVIDQSFGDQMHDLAFALNNTQHTQQS